MKRAILFVAAVAFCLAAPSPSRAQGYGSGYYYRNPGSFYGFGSASYTPYGGFPVYSNFNTIQIGNQTFWNAYQPVYYYPVYNTGYAFPTYAPARYAPAYYSTINGTAAGGGR